MYVISTVSHIFVQAYVDDHLGKLPYGVVRERLSDFCTPLTRFLVNITNKNTSEALLKKGVSFPFCQFHESQFETRRNIGQKKKKKKKLYRSMFFVFSLRIGKILLKKRICSVFSGFEEALNM